jgi:hypothetical protein
LLGLHKLANGGTRGDFQEVFAHGEAITSSRPDKIRCVGVWRPRERLSGGFLLTQLVDLLEPS